MKLITFRNQYDGLAWNHYVHWLEYTKPDEIVNITFYYDDHHKSDISEYVIRVTYIKNDKGDQTMKKTVYTCDICDKEVTVPLDNHGEVLPYLYPANLNDISNNVIKVELKAKIYTPTESGIPTLADSHLCADCLNYVVANISTPVKRNHPMKLWLLESTKDSDFNASCLVEARDKSEAISIAIDNSINEVNWEEATQLSDLVSYSKEPGLVIMNE